MDKRALRKHLRARRREHVAALPSATRGLVFSRPPATIADLAPEGSCVAIYQALGDEAPTAGYARWFHENGRRLALPRFASRTAPMEFHAWTNPWVDDEMEPGPFNIPQPRADASVVAPCLAIVPLLGFTDDCQRIGQGAGHYDQWLEKHPDVIPIGLAWDAQLCDTLPLEPHDIPLAAVVTPTRIFRGTI
jgi:5-formyltetrahydrofolate cyclo-ligase